MITDINVLAYVLTGGGVEDLIEAIQEAPDGIKDHRAGGSADQYKDSIGGGRL